MTEGIKLFGVAGNPVMHSKSPAMFNGLFRKRDINARYIKIASSSPEQVMKLFTSLNFGGINVTAPFKKSMAPLIKHASEDVIKTGSLNTIVKTVHGVNCYNTDHRGVTESLKKHKENLTGVKALVIGAGGAGISAAYGLVKEGADVTIINRTVDKAEKASELTGASFDSMKNIRQHMGNSSIIVITLPYEAPPIDISYLQRGSIILDASYKNSHYRDIALNSGITFIDGREWLINQAIPACEHFLGFRPEYSEMEISLNTNSGVKEIISLIGFMGSGKSTVGKLLAESLGYDFIDSDADIEKSIGMPIERFFTECGESAFRELEKKTILSLKGKSKIVLSCGGGAVTSLENRKFLKTSTTCFWLHTNPENSVKRIDDGSRPLLKTGNPLNTAKELFSRRRDLYADACDVLVSSDMEPEKITELINEEIRLSI
jgi:shikimate dehydrogenase